MTSNMEQVPLDPNRHKDNGVPIVHPKAQSGTARHEPQLIELPPIDLRDIEIRLIGESPLICHSWSDKAKKMMLGKQKGEAAQKKAVKVPEDDFKDSLYTLPNGGVSGRQQYGFPAVAFKSAAVSACRSLDMKMTEARQFFHVQGDLVTIICEKGPVMREDMVRLQRTTADIRYRGMFEEWSVLLTVRYDARSISAGQILNLFNYAGFGVGVGEWRPEKSGSFGMFRVATEKDSAA